MQNKSLKFFPLLFILIFGISAFAQVKKQTRSPNVTIEMTDDGSTSELLPITLSAVPASTNAKIGFKYFGANADSDISTILILKGNKTSYESGSFGAKVIIDGIPLKSDAFRSIKFIKKVAGEETVRLYLRAEEIAWMATGDDISIELYNLETNKKLETLIFIPARLKEFKDFARSILMIKSTAE